MNIPRTFVLTLACAGLSAAPVLARHDHDENLEIQKLGTFSAGLFSDEVSGAEISAHDPRTQRLFVVNGAQNRIDVLDIRDPAAPARLFSIDCAPYGGQPNSVAVSRGLVAVAVQAVTKTDPGQAVFFDADGRFVAAVAVGALPDMITFTPNGQFVLTANEGEPNPGYTIDPEGSVSIIRLPWLAKHVKQSDVRTATFAAFNHATLDASVRIFGPGATVAQDVEPEYITISHDSRTAYVTLQENNAIATIDIRAAKVTAIKGLGFKDHTVGPLAELFEFDPLELPSIGSTAANQPLFLGGFSGLAFEGIDRKTGRYKFVTHTDRGPNGEPTAEGRRPFLLPGFSPEVVRFELDRDSGELAITQRIALKRAGGVTPISGLPNLQIAGGSANSPHNDEIGIDLFGTTLPLDPLGGDFEGIVFDPCDGSFWMCDEYRPALYHFTKHGVLIDRFVPEGTAMAAGQPAGTFGAEVLPAVLAQRRQNRGFEAIALQGGKIYAFVQSPARNPETLGNSALNGMRNVRLLEFDPVSKDVRQFIYVMDNPNLAIAGNTRADKIGDMVAAGDGEFLVIERDDDSTVDGDAPAAIEKKVYRFNLADATDVGDLGLFDGRTVDQLSPAELLAHGIRPVRKWLAVDLNQAGYNTVQKVEGLALIDPWTIAVINDNDFQVAGIQIDNTTGTFSLLPDYVPEPVTLGLIDMQSNSLDASDRENGKDKGVINIRPWPVKGMYLPDAIDSFVVCGRRYLITANEGDARDYDGYAEEAAVGDLVLDATAFPEAAMLQKSANLGRLNVTTSRGFEVVNGGKVFSELYSFGGRSFSIWDERGSLVFDSGDTIEQVIAADPVFSKIFNASHTANTLDNRSDNKGPEPEAVVVGQVGRGLYAFVGLERVGGFMVFEVSDPVAPRFIEYVNNRDPAAVPGVDNGSDYGPEGLLFIEAWASPARTPLLVVSNEVSSTVTIYRLDRGSYRRRGGGR